MANDMPPAGGGVSATGYSAGITTSGGTNDDPPVWMGGTFDEGPRGHAAVNAPGIDPFTTHRKPRRSSEVIASMDKWTNEKKKALARRLVQAGYFGYTTSRTLDEMVADVTLADLERAWAAVVLEAAQKNANGVWVTPDDIISQKIDYAKSAAKGTDLESWLAGKDPAGAKEKDPNRTETSTSVSRDIFSSSEAKGLIRDVLQRELGRDPTAEEFEDFKDALNTEQRQNPSKTVTNTVYRDGDPVRYESTTTGGIDPQEFATEQAQANPDWAEWQAVGTYFPAAMNALGAGVQGV